MHKLLCVLSVLNLCQVYSLKQSDESAIDSDPGDASQSLHARFRWEHRDHTLSDVDSYQTLDMFLSLTVDMETETILGFVETSFVKIRPLQSYDSLGLERGLVLDIGEFVTVSRVEDALSGEPVSHHVECLGEDYRGVMKCALIIEERLEGVGEFGLRIHYSVDGSTSALHFIPSHQTHDGKNKFLMSVTQPSNTRSWIPCQDTPALKYPFRAEITVKAPYTVLMSGLQDGKPVKVEERDGEWTMTSFTQALPLPPYLIALTVADVGFIDVQEKGDSESRIPIRVWAEHSILQELKESDILSVIPRMLDICEQKMGKYPWGLYDIVLAPPGYLFGGMEYPGMNYVSSTTLDMGRLTTRPNYAFSQMVAHEMIHSWFGDAMTPRYTKDAWLSEGITVFMELEVMEEIYGEEIGMFIRRRKFSSLKNAILGYADSLRVLTPYLFEVHPFEGLNYVVYNKGALFLEYLANFTSRSEVESTLRSFVDMFYFRSVDTEDFLHVLRQTQPQTKEIEEDLTKWLELPGTDVPMELFSSEIYDFCKVLYQVCTRRKVKNASFNIKDIAEVYHHGNGTLTHLAPTIHTQMLIVLERLGKAASKPDMTITRIKSWKMLTNRLDTYFGFSNTYKTDPYTFSVWADLALAMNHTATEKVLLEFLERYGRIEMIFSVLGATENMDLRMEMANILATKHDMNVYPGYVEYWLLQYIDMFRNQ